MTPYPVIERRKRKWVKGYGILSFTRYISTKYEKKPIGYCYKSRTKWWKKNASKKVVHKTAEPTRELIGNKTAEKMWN